MFPLYGRSNAGSVKYILYLATLIFIKIIPVFMRFRSCVNKLLTGLASYITSSLTFYDAVICRIGVWALRGNVDDACNYTVFTGDNLIIQFFVTNVTE